MKHLWLAVLFFPFFLNALTWEKGSDTISVKIETPKTTLSLIEDLTLTMTLTYPESTKVDFNKIKANLLTRFSYGEPPFALKSFDKKELPGKMEASFTLKPKKKGTFALTFLNIPFETKGKTVEITSDIIPITVTSPKPIPNFKPPSAPLLTFSNKIPLDLSYENKTKYLNKDAFLKQSQRSSQRFNTKKFPWIELIGLMIVFFVFLFIHIQKPKKREKIEKEAKQIRAEALGALSSLKQTDADNFYTGITQIVRQYIEKTTGLNASSLTTEEFFLRLKQKPIFNEKKQKELIAFLEHTDKVKFGSYKPTDNEIDHAFQAAHHFLLN